MSENINSKSDDYGFVPTQDFLASKSAQDVDPEFVVRCQKLEARFPGVSTVIPAQTQLYHRTGSPLWLLVSGIKLTKEETMGGLYMTPEPIARMTNVVMKTASPMLMVETSKLFSEDESSADFEAHAELNKRDGQYARQVGFDGDINRNVPTVYAAVSPGVYAPEVVVFAPSLSKLERSVEPYYGEGSRAPRLAFLAQWAGHIMVSKS